MLGAPRDGVLVLLQVIPSWARGWEPGSSPPAVIQTPRQAETLDVQPAMGKGEE